MDPLSEENRLPEDSQSVLDQEEVLFPVNPRVDSEDGIPLMSTSISKEAFDEAVEVIRRRLYFASTPLSEPLTSRKSHLSLNKPLITRPCLWMPNASIHLFDVQAKT